MIGERIGNFEVSSLLGRGGMGEVYLGIHDKIGTKVAIKMLLPHISAEKEQVQRFFNEAIAAGKIQHAGIGKIFDVGFHEGGRAYLIMEFLGGESLAARIRRLGRLPLGMLSEIGRQISGVLEAVHKQGITHRDLKPDNIFIVPDDELPSGERVKILDFGIAKLTGASGGMTATSSGSMGTPAYMSPEQWRNTKNVDWRADAYSLGCLTFEMAAGGPPFVAETIGEACAKHLTEEPPRLGSLLAVPPALDGLIASLLAKDPDHRPASMREIGNAFGGLAGIATSFGPEPTQTSGPRQAPGETMSSGIMMHPTPPPMMPVTTLGATSGSALVPKPSRKKLGWILGGVGAAIAGLVVAAFALGGGKAKPDIEAECKDATQLWRCELDLAHKATMEGRSFNLVHARTHAAAALEECRKSSDCRDTHLDEIRLLHDQLQVAIDRRMDAKALRIAIGSGAAPGTDTAPVATQPGSGSAIAGSGSAGSGSASPGSASAGSGSAIVQVPPKPLPPRPLPNPPDPPLPVLVRADVQPEINKIRPKVKASCRDRAPVVRGLVAVVIQILPTGKVGTVTIERAPQPELGDCVARVLKTASFPRSQNGLNAKAKF